MKDMLDKNATNFWNAWLLKRHRGEVPVPMLDNRYGFGQHGWKSDCRKKKDTRK